MTLKNTNVEGSRDAHTQDSDLAVGLLERATGELLAFDVGDCPVCRGWGEFEGGDACDRCDATGKVTGPTCPECAGSGHGWTSVTCESGFPRCPKCAGSGVLYGRTWKLPTTQETTALQTRLAAEVERPVPMVLHCPMCKTQHVDAPDPTSCMDCGHDEGEHYGHSADPIDPDDIGCYKCGGNGKCEFRPWNNPPHKKHRCLKCNHVWKPALIPTNGVERLPEYPQENNQE